MSLYTTQVLQTRTTHTYTTARALDGVWAKLTDSLVSFAWPTASSIVRNNVLRTLSQISHGKLTIITPGEVYTFGTSSPQATLNVCNDAFWMKVALFTDLGLAESYMQGDVICEDISSLVKILIANRHSLRTLDNFTTSLLSVGRRITAYKFLGDSMTAPANISAHYDLGNVMFKSFLSEDMNYSSAIFKDYNEDLGQAIEARESLESAQLRKMRNILTKVKLQRGDRVLEIGTGWGSLSILAAQTVDCYIDTVTLSAEQRDFAMRRIAEEGLSDRITVHHMDFRECRSKPEWAGAFDKFISVEMIENVGRNFIPEYWTVVDWVLKPRSAIGVVQVITMPEARIPAYDNAGVDFIQKWIFPGCYMPSLCFLITTMNDGSSGRLTVDSVSNIGPHYARTLREWKRKFLSNWGSTISSTLVDQYALDADALAVFKRKWIYYFDYCEAGFATRSLGDHVITFTREANVDFGCDFTVTS